MILTGREIQERVASGDILIEPYFRERVAQASVDLHLHPKVLRCDSNMLDLMSDKQEFTPVKHLFRHRAPGGELVRGVLLSPGELYLGSTLECVYAPKHVAILDGKSSPARKGLKVHFTAGYVEPGFSGQITMEIEVSKMLFVPIGQPIAQLRFMEVVGEIEQYNARGHYTDNAQGPTLSKSHLHVALDASHWEHLL